MCSTGTGTYAERSVSKSSTAHADSDSHAGGSHSPGKCAASWTASCCNMRANCGEGVNDSKLNGDVMSGGVVAADLVWVAASPCLEACSRPGDFTGAARREATGSGWGAGAVFMSSSGSDGGTSAKRDAASTANAPPDSSSPPFPMPPSRKAFACTSRAVARSGRAASGGAHGKRLAAHVASGCIAQPGGVYGSAWEARVRLGALSPSRRCSLDIRRMPRAVPGGGQCPSPRSTSASVDRLGRLSV